MRPAKFLSAARGGPTPPPVVSSAREGKNKFHGENVDPLTHFFMTNPTLGPPGFLEAKIWLAAEKVLTPLN